MQKVDCSLKSLGQINRLQFVLGDPGPGAHLLYVLDTTHRNVYWQRVLPIQVETYCSGRCTQAPDCSPVVPRQSAEARE